MKQDVKYFKYSFLVSKHYLTYALFPPYAFGFATAAIMQLRIAPKTAGIPWRL